MVTIANKRCTARSASILAENAGFVAPIQDIAKQKMDMYLGNLPCAWQEPEMRLR